MRRVKHHDAMPYADLLAFVALLRERSDISSAALLRPGPSFQNR